MILFLMFLGIVLSIVKANGWIVVPTFCIAFCWIVSICSWFVYSYGRGAGEEIVKRMKNQDQEKKEE